MNHRLVGAIILGCLTVIFIPIILDGEGVKIPEVIEDIPPAPTMPEIPVIEAVRPQILSDSSQLNLSSDSSNEDAMENITLTEEPESGPGSLNEQGLPQSWSIQLGSFAEQANANTLVSCLLREGYNAYAKPLQSAERGTLTTVLVGPVLSKQIAVEMITKLDNICSLQGGAIVVEFVINELSQ